MGVLWGTSGVVESTFVFLGYLISFLVHLGTFRYFWVYLCLKASLTQASLRLQLSSPQEEGIRNNFVLDINCGQCLEYFCKGRIL